jgi:hypothetical protein
MILGNAIAKAKQLCAIFDAIDCWQGGNDDINNDDTNNGDDNVQCDWMCQVRKGFFGGKSMQTLASHKVSGVQLTSGRGTDVQAQFSAEPKDLLTAVRGICRVVDNGVSELPKLIPELISGGIGNDLLDKLLNGGNLDFSDIFMDDTGASSGAASDAGKILVTPSAKPAGPANPNEVVMQAARRGNLYRGHLSTSTSERQSEALYVPKVLVHCNNVA